MEREPSFPADRGRESKERFYPLITEKESAFIENTGGEYVGYEDDAEETRRFVEFRVDHRAYYDTERRQVVARFISTEAVDEYGEATLARPGEIRGFQTLFVTNSLTGAELDEPTYISIEPAHFTSRMSVSKLREIAKDLHDFLVMNASTLSTAELHRQAEERLAARGWRADESSTS